MYTDGGEESQRRNLSATLGAMPDGSTVRIMVINFGDSSANDAGMSVHFDNVVVGDHIDDLEVP